MKIKIALFGLGAWGKNYLRLIRQFPDLSLEFVCDVNNEYGTTIANSNSSTKFYTNYKVAIEQNSIDAAIVATDVQSHFEICAALLHAGVNTLCEKPVSTKVEEIITLSNLAKSTGRVIMPGHLFIYNDAFQYAKSLINNGELGSLQYFNFQRTNLGPVRHDVNAAFDLTTHDISMILSLVNEKPVKIFQFKNTFLKQKQESTAFLRLEFASGLVANFHASWICPKKVREMVVVGDKKMLIFDDVSHGEKIKIYDKYEPANNTTADFSEFQLNARNVNMIIPDIIFREPLRLQLEDFIKTITLKNHIPLTSITDAIEVVKILNGSL